jgi:hypothetical protein
MKGRPRHDALATEIATRYGEALKLSPHILIVPAPARSHRATRSIPSRVEGTGISE